MTNKPDGVVTMNVRGDWQKKIQLAKRSRKDFYYTTTNSSVIVREDQSRYIYSNSDKRYNIAHFNLFQRLKAEVLANIESKKLVVPPTRARDVEYFRFAESVYQTTATKNFSDVWELDINMAYYNAARELGYISDEFYNECVDLTKYMRLRLIGSIAIFKTKYIYKRGKLVDVQVISNPLLRSVWFHICSYVSKAMQDMASILNKDFVFFWVDGIVFTGKKNRKKIEDFIYLKYGFEFKFLQMDGVRVIKEDKILSVIVDGSKDGKDSRSFFADLGKKERAMEMIRETNKLMKK